jgi:poly-gamma-glutamate capsule biosynthesis protein CapA/YwtB (metallophosphatase superfamily)
LNACVNRREFLLRFSAAAAVLAASRRAAAAGAVADSAAAPADSSRAARAKMPGGVALIAAAGDTTLGFNLQAHFDEQLATGMPRDFLYPTYFAGVKPIFDWADLRLVNLECPFTERGEPIPKNFNFRARRELVEILRQGNVDAVTLANNHLMDYGADGLADTEATLDGAGIGHFGAGVNLADARKPLIVERGGVRLGFLGYYFQDARDMREPAALYAGGASAGVAGCFTDLACMKAMLQADVAALAPRVDAVIPFFHWGHEGAYEVRDYQIELAHLAVDRGCRAVLGAHPHRFQGVEVYRGAPIFYSLGNFVFGGNKDPQDKLSAVARLRVPREGAVEAELVPIQITRWPEAPFQPFPLELDDKLAALARIGELSRGFPETLQQLKLARLEAASRGLSFASSDSSATRGPGAAAADSIAARRRASADSSSWSPR